MSEHVACSNIHKKEINKPIINMRNWAPYTEYGYFLLYGVADNHPRLGKNITVTSTSEALNVTLDNDILKVETLNSIYICPLKFIKLQHTNKVGDIEIPKIESKVARFINAFNKLINTEDYQGNDTYAKHIIKLIKLGKIELEQIEQDENTKLINEAIKYKQSLYLEISSISQGNDAAYHINGKTGVIKPNIHVGTFQDSILYLKHNLVDFRYFPELNNMQIYSWSDNIENLVIKNNKGRFICVNNIEIAPGQTMIVDRDTYSCGLISPSYVNGKDTLK